MARIEGVTMRDVARAAGVSVATVSRVLTGNRAVTPEIAKVVRAASARLGYRTHYVARALRRRTTQTIGMVVPYIANPFFPGVVQAVERSLHPAGHELLLCDSQDDPDTEARRVRALLDRRVDGLLIIPCDMRDSAAAVREAARHAPVVQVDRYVTGVPGDSVGVDNAAGIHLVVRHLEPLGRRRLAFVGAQPSISTAGERLEAYRREAGRRDRRAVRRVLLGDFSAEWGSTAAEALCSEETPEGIVCANDLIALGVLRQLRSMGLRVPLDVAVTGFDDIGFATMCDPPLTTARQPVDDIGGEAVRLLLARLGGHPGRSRRVRLRPRLMVRASTVGTADRIAEKVSL